MQLVTMLYEITLVIMRRNLYINTVVFYGKSLDNVADWGAIDGDGIGE